MREGTCELVGEIAGVRSEIGTTDYALSTRRKVAGTKELFRLSINLEPTVLPKDALACRQTEKRSTDSR